MVSKNYALFFMLCIAISHTHAQSKYHRLKGEAILQLSDLLPVIEQKEKLKNLAIKNALELGYGSRFEGVTINRISKTGEESVATYDRLLESKTRGKLRRIISIDFSELTREVTIDGDLVFVKFLQCRVEIEASGEENTISGLEAKALNCPDLRCVTDEFENEDDILLYVKSPADGYLAVFLESDKLVDRLLPGSTDVYSSKGFPVRKDERYVFFSDQPKDTTHVWPITDSYEMTADRPVDINRLYVVFSKTPIMFPKGSKENTRLSNKELKLGYRVPESVSNKVFHKWIKRFTLKNDSVNRRLERISLVVKK